jgi:hypothetical protein
MSTRILHRIACIAVTLGIGVLRTPSSVNAEMRVELVSNGQGIIASDQGNTGLFTTTSSIGAFTVNVTTGTSSPPLAPPPGTYASLDLNSVNIATTSAGTITIILENSSYTAPTEGLGAIGKIGGTIINGTVTAASYVDATNSLPFSAPDQTLGSLQAAQMPGSANSDLSFTYASANDGFSGSGSTTFNNTGTFSLYQELVITFGAGGGQFSADLSNSIVPEPSSLAIAGLGGLGMIGYGLRRRRKAQGALANPSSS